MTASRWEFFCTEAIPKLGLLGLELAMFPYLSGYGMLLRTLRLNGFGQRDLFAIFGIRALHDLDLMRACHRPGAARSRFEMSVGLHHSQIPNFWSEETWCPISLNNRWNELHLAPRHCRECLRYGYHCSLFQMPFVDHCPWHGTKLFTACQQCGKTYQGWLPIKGPVTRCACGFDSFDLKTSTVNMLSFPAASATKFLEQHWQWCERERGSRYLVAPSTTHAWYPALKHLVILPSEKSIRHHEATEEAYRIHRWDVSCQKSLEPKPNAFWPWISMATSTPIGIAPLPSALHRPLAKISKIVTSHFPAAMSLNLEKDSSKKARRITLGALVAGKPHHFILPFGGSPQAGTWLHLSTVLPESLDVCGCLVDSVDRHITGPTEASRFHSAETEKSLRFDQLTGRRVLQSALFHLLLKGFAIGLAITLTKLTRCRQEVRRADYPVPIAELTCNGGDLGSISVCWVAEAKIGLVTNTSQDAAVDSRIRTELGCLAPTTTGRGEHS